MYLAVLLGFGADLLVAGQPAGQVHLQQLGLQIALHQQCADAQQLRAEIPVIDITLDGRQDQRQGQFKRNERDVRHALILNVSHVNAHLFSHKTQITHPQKVQAIRSKDQ